MALRNVNTPVQKNGTYQVERKENKEVLERLELKREMNKTTEILGGRQGA